MDDETAKAYGRIMLLEIIFKNILVGIYGQGMNPAAGIEILKARKAEVLDQIEGTVVQEFDPDAARTAENAMKTRAEELFDEVISAIRDGHGLKSDSTSPSGGTPQKGDKAH